MLILNLLPIAVTICGVWFLFKLRFFFIVNPKLVFKKIKSALLREDSRRSLMLALAGTLGVGNIVGVAVGLSVGGAGSVFWLLVSSVFAMVIKYAEAIISADMGQGIGMIGVVRKSFGTLSNLMSRIYALLILLLCFVMGAMLQSASIGQSLDHSFGFSGSSSAILLLILILPVLIFGADKVDKITAIAIPMATIVYIFLAFSAIFINFERLPGAVFSIVSSAFEADSITGGILAYLSSAKIREGYMRGLLSNEAGAGTSSLAHSRNFSLDIGEVGVMGICEVFLDTTLLCTLTALATLVSLPSLRGLSGMEIVLAGIGNVYGNASAILTVLSIFVFAYSTVVCWYYYGSCAFKYLFGRGERVFSALFLIFTLFGVFVKGDGLVSVSDFILLLLALICLSAITKNSDRIKLLSERSGLISPRR